MERMVRGLWHSAPRQSVNRRGNKHLSHSHLAFYLAQSGTGPLAVDCG